MRRFAPVIRNRSHLSIPCRVSLAIQVRSMLSAWFSSCFGSGSASRVCREFVWHENYKFRNAFAAHRELRSQQGSLPDTESR